ncbi:MAG: hypothetical protein EB010_12330, partial [Acidimicrobiia bacterium]|nr:hypothetical protein [Acidimicrobiia bacterium]
PPYGYSLLWRARGATVGTRGPDDGRPCCGFRSPPTTNQTMNQTTTGTTMGTNSGDGAVHRARQRRE